jgi:hypothetical protein
LVEWVMILWGVTHPARAPRQNQLGPLTGMVHPIPYV